MLVDLPQELIEKFERSGFCPHDVRPMKASELKPGGGVMQTAVKERPILFSGPMVRAILDGRKTQTRRVVKYSQPAGCNGYWPAMVDGVPKLIVDGNRCNDKPLRCPYGKAGDRLWVRETWLDNLHARTPADGLNEVYYRADGEAHKQFPGDYMDARWKPSIHMPRWASRITLEITGVRVERLKQITDNDIAAEGIESLGSIPGTGGPSAGQFEGKYSTLRQLFSGLWVEINGDGSWAANPLVWVIEFQRKESAQ